MVSLQFRVKTRNGQYVVDSLKMDNSIGELKAVVWSVTKLHPDKCRVLMGYPPEEVFLVDDEQLIQEIFKNPRETLILEEISSGGNNVKEQEKPAKLPLKQTMRRVDVPANNSCLFVSCYYAITGKMQNKCPQLRELIAETVKSDPVTYNEGFLGKPNSEYCTWIRNEDHWGGGIELSILAKYYSLEIVAVDIQNTRLNRFGEDMSYPYRIFLIFDGIHYDPLIVESNDVNNPVQTKFSSKDTQIVNMAVDFARDAKAKHQYTDLKTMILRCKQCNKSFTEADARAHASSSGHIDFSEVTN